MPWLREAFPTHSAFSTAGIEDIMSTSLSTSVSAATLAHTLFLNRGDRFDAIPLPPEAQWAPAFGVTVADFDGDGHEDAFLAQNHFSAQPFTPRCDAGRGLLLRGDGKGGLTPLPAGQSGIAVFGEMRGCASADYDGDGRTDLVVTQNGAATCLFHNATARPGLRVKLAGPPGNLDGIGAQVRLLFAKGRGPIRELHAGSGYWSQDSLTPVLATPGKPVSVWVRWPGGKIGAAKIPPGATEVTVPFGR